jgi:predicted metal-dependent HD superfamily phosphohydrolase
MLVVKAAGEIAMESNLSTEDLENILIAAWLHDTGYASGGSDDHEERSVSTAQIFLDENSVDKQKTALIISAIMATKMPQQPQSITDKILCDADLYSLSLPDVITSEKLREEWKRTKNKSFTEEEWLMNNLTFIQSHQYFTNYGRTVLETRKAQNVQSLKKLLRII